MAGKKKRDQVPKGGTTYSKLIVAANDSPEKRTTAARITAAIAGGASVAEIAAALSTSPGAIYQMRRGIRAASGDQLAALGRFANSPPRKIAPTATPAKARDASARPPQAGETTKATAPAAPVASEAQKAMRPPPPPPPPSSPTTPKATIAIGTIRGEVRVSAERLAKALRSGLRIDYRALEEQGQLRFDLGDED